MYKRLNLILSAALILSFSVKVSATSTKIKKKKTLVASHHHKNGEPIIVAVIDTGIKDFYKDANFICKSGNKDFTGMGLTDHHGHGTHISGLIDQYAKDIILDGKSGYTISDLLKKKINYCQVILKFYDPVASANNNLENELKALEYAINIKVDIINFSGGGYEFSDKENSLIKRALDAGIKVVVAAGNGDNRNGYSLEHTKYYPASSDSRLIVVGNLSQDLKRALSSNYGSIVTDWIVGTHVFSLGVDDKIGAYMTGTSQSTAIKSGKIVREMLNK